MATLSQRRPTAMRPIGALRGHGDFLAMHTVHDAIYVRTSFHNPVQYTRVWRRKTVLEIPKCPANNVSWNRRNIARLSLWGTTSCEPDAAITGHLYSWTDFLFVTSSSAIPETAQHSPPMPEWNLTGSTPALLPTCHRGGIQQSGQHYFPPEAHLP